MKLPLTINLVWPLQIWLNICAKNQNKKNYVAINKLLTTTNCQIKTNFTVSPALVFYNALEVISTLIQNTFFFFKF